MSTDCKLSNEQRETIINTLELRFKDNFHRHEELNWEYVLNRIEDNPEKLWSLYQMESTGGEPDVIGYDKETEEYIFCDCSKDSPKGRRSLCYDRKALDSRKDNKPLNSVLDMAKEIGIEVLNEEQYYMLQEIEEFDTKTSSWIKTPEKIRALGGAIFCDRRFDTVFTYHNGAESYYSGRGFRGILRV